MRQGGILVNDEEITVKMKRDSSENKMLNGWMDHVLTEARE